MTEKTDERTIVEVALADAAVFELSLILSEKESQKLFLFSGLNFMAINFTALR